MVGKDQIGTPEVDVDRVPEFLAHHGGAFDVPARPAGAPGGGEAGFPRFGALPEREVEGVVLARFLGIAGTSAGALLLLLDVPAAEPAVAPGPGHREVHIAVGAVGRPAGFQLADQGTDRLQAAGGPGGAVRRQDVQGRHVDGEGVDVALAHLFHRAAFFCGPVEDLVVDIGEVLNERHLPAAPDQIAAQHIPDDVTPGMAQVAEVVDRDPAAVDGHPPWLQRFEVLKLPGEGIGEPQGQFEAPVPCRSFSDTGTVGRDRSAESEPEQSKQGAGIDQGADRLHHGFQVVVGLGPAMPVDHHHIALLQGGVAVGAHR